MIFIKIKDTIKLKKKESKRKRIIQFLLELIIPKANPDFDDKIQLIAFWLLEFTSADSIPQREIGLRNDGEVVVKMPYKENYGYWSDNNLTYHDFQKLFEVEYITKEYFEEMWIIEPSK